MRRILRENGLSIVWFGLFFLAFIIGLSIMGHREYNNEQIEHGEAPIEFVQYLTSSHFVSATMENWESEFLQMFLFIVLTAMLYQKGSAESKKIDEEEEVDRDPRQFKDKKDAPWPVRRGGWVLSIYQYSLSIAFFLLFAVSFFLHAKASAIQHNEEEKEHGSTEQISTIEFMGTSRFWFESFQNWQSEFLAVGAMVVLSIYLRHKGSPESKPVDAAHSDTGKG
jgi:hypothetical protein